MARLIVDFSLAKTKFFYLALTNKGRKTAAGALLHRRIKITDAPKSRIKIIDTPKPKVDALKVAEALGADMCIPLGWVHSFKADEDTLTIMFEDDVSFRVDGDKLSFIKDNEKGFASINDVQKVYIFGEATQALEVLWEKQ